MTTLFADSLEVFAGVALTELIKLARWNKAPIPDDAGSTSKVLNINIAVGKRKATEKDICALIRQAFANCTVRPWIGNGKFVELDHKMDDTIVLSKSKVSVRCRLVKRWLNGRTSITVLTIDWWVNPS